MNWFWVVVIGLLVILVIGKISRLGRRSNDDNVIRPMFGLVVIFTKGRDSG